MNEDSEYLKLLRLSRNPWLLDILNFLKARRHFRFKMKWSIRTVVSNTNLGVPTVIDFLFLFLSFFSMPPKSVGTLAPQHPDIYSTAMCNNGKIVLKIGLWNRNGILLPKMFWPNVRKIVLVFEKKICNSRLKAENLQKFWDH